MTVAAIGETVIYHITVTNVGTLPAENVVVVDQLPPYLSLIQFVISRGTATFSDRQITVTLGDVAPGEVITIDVTTQITSGREADVPNIAQLSTDSGTNDPSNDVAESRVQIVGGQPSTDPTMTPTSTETPPQDEGVPPAEPTTAPEMTPTASAEVTPPEASAPVLPSPPAPVAEPVSPGSVPADADADAAADGSPATAENDGSARAPAWRE